MKKTNRWRVPRWLSASVLAFSTAGGVAVADSPEVCPDAEAGRPHVVFLAGDREYRSEESMPMLARILKNRHGLDVTVCYTLSDEGVIDPNRPDNFVGIEALEDADLLVVYISWRQPTPDEMGVITDFIKRGGPLVGFRPSVLPFEFPSGHENEPLNTEWPHEVLGLRWISHHGAANSTDASVIEEQADHPILRGVEPFWARSWLYEAEEHVHKNVEPLMRGRAVKGGEPGGDYFGDPHPVAWTHRRTRDYGGGRTFFVTMGNPEDFFEVSMRRLSIQGMFWAMGMEDQIPEEGLDVELMGEYDPNAPGFGPAYKPDMRPEDIPLR